MFIHTFVLYIWMSNIHSFPFPLWFEVKNLNLSAVLVLPKHEIIIIYFYVPYIYICDFMAQWKSCDIFIIQSHFYFSLRICIKDIMVCQRSDKCLRTGNYSRVFVELSSLTNVSIVLSRYHPIMSRKIRLTTSRSVKNGMDPFMEQIQKQCR